MILRTARRAAGLTQAELARLAGTSQATLSTYERGRQAPSLKTVGRLLAAAGFDLALAPLVDFEEHQRPGIEPFWVPSTFWRVHTPDCFATIGVPDLTGDTDQHEWDLRDRAQRRRAYEILILHALPQSMIRWLDGALLIDLWDDLDLPDVVRNAWTPAYALATNTKRVDVLTSITEPKHGALPEEAHLARVRGYRMLPRARMTEEKYVTAAHAAEMLGLSSSLLNRLIADGVVPAETPIAGHQLIRLRDVRAFQDQHQNTNRPAHE
ncbi:helix-turn-helix domain-containing protein [Nocardioides sp. NPDC101246]|uniref:helix-turn-helix domain-containing protein n=1 Tax=Nocardioides sp. NPDC101246 TaxID=3364336 RepID=UPI0038003A61